VPSDRFAIMSVSMGTLWIARTPKVPHCFALVTCFSQRWPRSTAAVSKVDAVRLFFVFEVCSSCYAPRQCCCLHHMMTAAAVTLTPLAHMAGHNSTHGAYTSHFRL
jgi:hypothetical protein